MGPRKYNIDTLNPKCQIPITKELQSGKENLPFNYMSLPWVEVCYQ